MPIFNLLEQTAKFKASDIHISVGSPAIIRVNGDLIPLGEDSFSAEDTLRMIKQITTPEQQEIISQKGEIDFSYSTNDFSRFRINAYKQKGSYALAARLVALEILPLEDLGLADVLTELANKKRGLILVTGPAGSGKSTTLAAIIDYINRNRNEHILTLEDPIEFLHKNNKSLVNQREIGADTDSFSSALRSALRQDPDVILVGEMRDLETIAIALTAAETGHLVLSSLHTLGAAKTIDRIIDVFPPHQQKQIQIQLSSVLQGVISQQLLPRIDKNSRIAAFEVMISTNAISNLIREGKTHQMQTTIQTSSKIGMQTMDTALIDLYKSGKINKENLEKHAIDNAMITRLTADKLYS